MGSKIKKIKLKDILEITSSKRIFMSEYADIGVPFYRSKEIIEKAKGSSISTELFISEDKFNDIEKKFGVPVGGDILLTSVGTIGIPYLVQEDDKFYFKDGNLTWFKNFSNELNNKFMLCWLQSKDAKNQFDMITIGSTQKALTISSLKELEIPLPSLSTQKKIAHILSTLDDKIELNRKMNQTLESMASAIFKSWFVDFDPVHAKANCTDEAELENIAKKLGISKEILDLFPSEFEESELGMIPKGWKVKELKEISKITMGQSPKGESYNYDYEGLPLLNGATDFSNGILTPTKFTTDSKRKADTGELVFCIRATIGLLTYTDRTYSLGRGVASINAKELFKELIYLRLNTQIEQMKSNASGSVILGLSKDDIEKLKVIVSTDKVMNCFNKTLKSLFSQITVNTQEIQTLQKTRDLLLPKLLSGEIDVSDLSLEME